MRPFLALLVLCACLHATSIGCHAAARPNDSRHLYQITERKVSVPRQRQNEQTLTFSGDVSKILAMANQKGLAAMEAEANQDENDNNEEIVVIGEEDGDVMDAATSSPVAMNKDPSVGPTCPSPSSTVTSPHSTPTIDVTGTESLPASTSPPAGGPNSSPNIAPTPTPAPAMAPTAAGADSNSGSTPTGSSSTTTQEEGTMTNTDEGSAPTDTGAGSSSSSSSPETAIDETNSNNNGQPGATPGEDNGEEASAPGPSPGSTPSGTNNEYDYEYEYSAAPAGTPSTAGGDSGTPGSSPTEVGSSGSTPSSPTTAGSNGDSPASSPTTTSGSNGLSEEGNNGVSPGGDDETTIGSSPGGTTPTESPGQSPGSSSGSSYPPWVASSPTVAPVLAPSATTSSGSSNGDSGSSGGAGGQPTADSGSGGAGQEPTADSASGGVGQPTAADTSESATGEDGMATEDTANAGIDTESDANLPPAASPTTMSDGYPPPTATTDTDIDSSSSSLISCDGASLDRPEFIYFTYSLEAESSDDFVVDDIRLSAEQVLSSNVAKLLLPCGEVRRLVRRLQGASDGLGFEGIDFVPEDSFSATTTCEPTESDTNGCTVLDGVLAIYIAEEADFELVNYYALTAIRTAFGSLGGQVEGLIKATYIGPDIVNPSSIAANNNDNGGSNDITNGPGNLNSSVFLYAVGVVSLVLSLTLIVYMRRRNRTGQSGEATMAAGTDHQSYSRDGSNSRSTLSPFSEMLPQAYRFDQDGNMSAILELSDSADESATQRSGIVVSDSGFTTEEENSLALSSLDGTSVVNRSHSPVLGAEKRPQDESMDDSLLELL